MLQGSPRSPLRVLAARLVTRETEVLTLAESQGKGQVWRSMDGYCTRATRCPRST